MFRAAERIYVAANMLFYHEEGNPSAVRSPDVFAVKGVHKRDRRSYKLWEERAAPCLVIEVTSKSTWLEDHEANRLLYERLAEYLEPRLQALVLEGGRYRRSALQVDGTWQSAELGVILSPEETLLRVVDPETGGPVPRMEEAVAVARRQEERAKSGIGRMCSTLLLRPSWTSRIPGGFWAPGTGSGAGLRPGHSSDARKPRPSRRGGRRSGPAGRRRWHGRRRSEPPWRRRVLIMPRRSSSGFAQSWPHYVRPDRRAARSVIARRQAPANAIAKIRPKADGAGTSAGAPFGVAVGVGSAAVGVGVGISGPEP
ncbi:MAG: Uma2 family endonuclease [Candidatus Schekmanbacteria bacterium]|nr:Uma2 family endonuclease [Candidatus Schekmanbacteria bacterium]